MKNVITKITKNISEVIKIKKEVLTTGTTISTVTRNTSVEGELKETTSNNNSFSDLLSLSKSSKVLPKNINVPPTKIKIRPEWEDYLPHLEKATKVENLNWSDSHEKAFKELTYLTSKMNLSPKNMNKLSHLLNSEYVPINDLFETNRELFFNEGELAKLLLKIGANVPMQDFNTYLTEVHVDLDKIVGSQIWIMPSKKICINDVLKTFPDSQQDFYRNLSSPSFFDALSSNNLIGDKAEIWALLENFKSENLTLRTKSDWASYSLKNKVSGGSGSQSAPSTPISYNGNTDELFLKLLSSQPKLFNNNFQLLREITRLDEESFNHYWRVFIKSLRCEESINAMQIILEDRTYYSGEISALVNELKNQTPLYENSAILKKWRNSKYDFEEVISSLIKIKGDSLSDLDDFRLVKSDKASEMFNFRFTNGVINPVNVRWWKSFNQLCLELKYLDQLEKQWINLSEKEKEVMKSVFIGEKQTLNHFMINDFSATRKKLDETLKDICAGAPFDNEYLLGHDWCYSEYSILLEKNNITLKNQLNVINDFSELLTSLIKFRHGSVEDRIKIKCQILNYIYDKNLLVIWVGSGYIYFLANGGL